MSILRFGAGLLGLIAASTAPWALSAPPTPTAGALERASNIQATHLGTDRFGNLWWWNRNSRTLRVLSAEGEWILTRQLEGRLPTVATFDAEWGGAALDMDRDLLLLPRSGAPPVRVARDSKATSLTWLGSGRLAVGPSRAAHRVEIWDVEKRRIVERWGQEEPISDGPGFHRLRAVLLAWDDDRERLWTLETFTGDLIVLSSEGQEVMRRTLRHPRLEEMRAWVEKMEGKEARETSEKEDTYLNLWTSLTLAPDGAAWVLEPCDKFRGLIKALRISSDGRVERRELDLGGCCPSGFRFWGSEIVPFQDPRIPGRHPCK